MSASELGYEREFYPEEQISQKAFWPDYYVKCGGCEEEVSYREAQEQKWIGVPSIQFDKPPAILIGVCPKCQ